MTKKHFILIAADMHRAIKEGDSRDRDCILNVARDLCDVFKQVNSNFDRTRFMDAVELGK